jgi:hypothetical protein
MRPAVTKGERLAEASAAYAELVELMRSRRGRGLDLETLLTVRHLSRMYSFRCGEPRCTERSVELEGCASELHAETRREAAERIAHLEWRIGRLLAEIEGCLERSGAEHPKAA